MIVEPLTPDTVAPEAMSVAAALAITGAAAAETARVQSLLRRVTRAAEIVARVPLWFRSYREVAQGRRGERRLWLSARPIYDVLDGPRYGAHDADEIDAGTEPDEYAVRESHLWRAIGWAPGLREEWFVQYRGGYVIESTDSPPNDAQTLAVNAPHLLGAIEDLLRFNWQKEDLDLTVRSERIGGAAPLSVEYRDVAGVSVPAAVERMLCTLWGTRSAAV